MQRGQLNSIWQKYVFQIIYMGDWLEAEVWWDGNINGEGEIEFRKK